MMHYHGFHFGVFIHVRIYFKQVCPTTLSPSPSHSFLPKQLASHFSVFFFSCFIRIVYWNMNDGWFTGGWAPSSDYTSGDKMFSFPYQPLTMDKSSEQVRPHESCTPPMTKCWQAQSWSHLTQAITPSMGLERWLSVSTALAPRLPGSQTPVILAPGCPKPCSDVWKCLRSHAHTHTHTARYA